MEPDFATAWQRQIAWCDANASPFTARVLEAALADWHAGGALRTLLPCWPGDAWADALPLRVAGALHAMALDGSEPMLASQYPPQCERFDPIHAPAAISRALAQQASRVTQYLQSPPQTNEIGRSAVLLGGFAEVAHRTRLPLATLEIGASAGLNTLWPRYRYELGAFAWGDAARPVRIRSDWQGHLPTLPAVIAITHQAANDVAPIDLRSPTAALRLASYVWPDQQERLARLRAAVALAIDTRVHVETGDAASWAARKLAAPRDGEATVLYHSVVWQYLAPQTREALQACIAAAGQRATSAAPLAWLAFEPATANSAFELSLTLWPRGERRVLATAHPHGSTVHWL